MTLEEQIEISAPPEVVWAVTVNLERWPEWTPTVTTVRRIDQGPMGVGSAAWLKQPSLPEAKWVVTEFTPQERFRWETQVRGLRMIGTHEIAPWGAGARSLLRIEMTGLVAKLLGPLIRHRVRRALEQENIGLKRRCETLAAS